MTRPNTSLAATALVALLAAAGCSGASSTAPSTCVHPCAAPSDCAATGNACVSRTCEGGCCGTANVAVGTATPTQTSGDCQQVQCDGAGGTQSVADDADVPAGIDACHVGTCANGTPEQAVAPAGTPCTFAGGVLCGDPAGLTSGACVQCNAPSDCTDPSYPFCTGAGACVPPSCTDRMRDGTETDVDCGGSCPTQCADGKRCNGNADCVHGYCTAGGLCATPTCTDGAKNGTETDVDCGGSSCVSQGHPCADGRSCSVNADCANGFCHAGACATPTCSDGYKNGSETDVDCGGTTCVGLGHTCAPGMLCNAGSDCTSGYCQSGVCALRPAGSACSADAQCASGTCGTTGSGYCCAAACPAGGGVCGAIGCGVLGECQYPGSGTACGSSCSNGQVTVSTCNGVGSCVPTGTTACANHFACAGSTCQTTCANAATDCVAGYMTCSGGLCAP